MTKILEEIINDGYIFWMNKMLDKEILDKKLR